MLPLLFHDFAGDHGGIGQPQSRKQGGKRLFEHHPQGITIHRLQSLDRVRFPWHHILRTLNAAEELGQRSGLCGFEETDEGVDEIVRRHLPTMMELDPAAQGEGPGTSVLRSLPKLGKSGNRVQVGIELDQAIEQLCDDGAAKDVGRKGGIERWRVVEQRTAVRPAELRTRLATAQRSLPRHQGHGTAASR